MSPQLNTNITYQSCLLDRLSDSDKWPTFERGEFLDELNRVADEAYNKKTLEGYLASLLIYQQLVEEMSRLLINCSDFFIQLSIFPIELKSNEKLDDLMFGQLLAILEKGVIIEGTGGFIKTSKELNQLRINMVHKLARKTNLTEIATQTKKVKNIFDTIYESFEAIYDLYRSIFHDYEKNIEDMRECL